MPKLPSSVDVPTVSPTISQDPGVRAPAGAFESPLGVAAEEFAPAAQKFAEVKIKQDNRRNTIDRSDKINRHTEDADAEYRRLNAEEDLSDEGVLSAYGSFLTERKQALLEEHRAKGGTEDSIAILTLRLGDVEAKATGVAAGTSTKLGREKVQTTYNKRLTALGESASQDTSLANLNKLIGIDAQTTIDDLKDAIDPTEERQFLQTAQEHVVLSATDSLINRGRIEEAESLLIDGGMNRFLSPEQQRLTRRRIDTVVSARKDAVNEANKVRLVEKAKMDVRREFISSILSDPNVPSLIPGDKAVDTPAITTPFTTEDPVSDDMQSALRAFTASRRLLLADETQLASGLLTQARFIIDNSSEIQRNKELDKPISEDLAREFGVPVGTPLRSIMGAIPRSMEELAEAKGAATARGKGRVAGEEQVAFIGEANTIVDDLLDEIQTDPGVVGVRGSLRSTGQTAFQVLGDLGARGLVERARNLAFENTDLGIDNVNDMFDSPTLSTLGIMENSIGMILARLRTPTGRIPVDVIKRSIDDVQLTGLKSSEQIENRLNFIRDQLNRRAGAIQKQFDLPQDDVQTDIGTPRFKVQGGKLVPMQGEQ